MPRRLQPLQIVLDSLNLHRCSQRLVLLVFLSWVGRLIIPWVRIKPSF